MDENPQEELVVIVETQVAKENVSRLAQSQGYSLKVEEDVDEYRLTLVPSKKAAEIS